jgi:hypothetical protein
MRRHEGQGGAAWPSYGADGRVTVDAEVAIPKAATRPHNSAQPKVARAWQGATTLKAAEASRTRRRTAPESAHHAER